MIIIRHANFEKAPITVQRIVRKLNKNICVLNDLCSKAWGFMATNVKGKMQSTSYIDFLQL